MWSICAAGAWHRCVHGRSPRSARHCRLTVLAKNSGRIYDQGLISGQGSIQAIWDYKHTECADDFEDDAELANYFSQLLLRFREGSKFEGFFVFFNGRIESVWYEADCICTSVGMGFSPETVINSSIQFVTTGQVQLKQGALPSYLLEDDGEILLETPPGAIELEFAQ